MPHRQQKAGLPLVPARRAVGGRELLAGHSPPKVARAGELCCLVCQSTDLLTFSVLLGLLFCCWPFYTRRAVLAGLRAVIKALILL